MKTLSIIFVLSLTCVLARAQDTITYLFFGSEFDENAVKAFESDSGYHFFGSTGARGQSDVYIVEINKDLSNSKFKVIGTSALELMTDVVALPGDNYVICNQYYSGFGSTGFDVQLIVLNDDLDIERTTVIEKNGSDKPIQIFYENGFIYLLSEALEEESSSDRFQISVFDSLLNRINTFSIQSSDSILNLTISVDSFIYVGATTRAQDSSHSDISIFKLNQTGLLINSQSIGLNDDEQVSSVLVLNDTNLLVTGSSNSVYDEDFDSYIALLDTDLNFQWEEIHGWNPNVNNRDDFGVMTLWNQGKYFLGLTTNTYGAGKSDFHVYELKSNGSFTKGNSFGLKENEALKHISITSDTNLLLFGNSANGNIGQNDFFAVLSPLELSPKPINEYVYSDSLDIQLSLDDERVNKTQVVELGKVDNGIAHFYLSNEKPTRYFVSDLSGRQIQSGTIDSELFKFPIVTSGFYIFSFENEQGMRSTFKLGVFN